MTTNPVTVQDNTRVSGAGSRPAVTSGPPVPVEYNIANLSSPQQQAASLTAPAYSAVANAQQAAVENSQLNTFFGSGNQYAPMYYANYQPGLVAGAPAQSTGGGQAASGSVT